MRACIATQIKENEILLDCYQQFEKQYQSNNFQFDIKLQQTFTFQTSIKLTTIKNKGRCWVATKPIKSGQLLLMEKAFVFSSRTQHPFGDLYSDINYKNHTQKTNENLVFDETAILMAQLIKQKIITNSIETINDMNYLYPRSNEIDFMETFQAEEYGIETEHDLWLFKHYLSQISQHNDILLKRIPYIVYCNAMMITQNTEQLCYFTSSTDDCKEHSSSYSDMIGDAIFLKGSFFNHDCDPNSNRYFIGDIMIVKALKDIGIGEECTFSYLESEYLCESDTFRAERLPFDCNCNKCIQQQSEKHIESDELDDIQIFNEIQCEQLMSNEPIKRIKMIDELMKSSDIRYVDVMSGFSAKAMAFLEVQKYEEAGKCWMKCIESIKISLGDIHENMVPFYVQCILCKINKLIIESNDVQLNEDDIIEMVRKNVSIVELIKNVIKVHGICFGGDALFFLKRYWNELSFSGYPIQSKSYLLWNSIIRLRNS